MPFVANLQLSTDILMKNVLNLTQQKRRSSTSYVLELVELVGDTYKVQMSTNFYLPPNVKIFYLNKPCTQA